MAAKIDFDSIVNLATLSIPLLSLPTPIPDSCPIHGLAGVCGINWREGAQLCAYLLTALFPVEGISNASKLMANGVFDCRIL
jgi:hypothetical protein